MSSPQPAGFFTCTPGVFFTACLCLSVPAFPQSAVKITGFVRDAVTGAPLTGAHVIVVNTPIGSATGSNGEYRIAHLPLGAYTLRVSHVGYAPVEKTGIHVREDYVARCDFYLTAAAIELEGITVTAERPGLRAAPVTRSRTVISQVELARMNARTVADALETVPGVHVFDSGGAAGSKRISLRGGAASQTLILLDGKRMDSGQNDAVDLSNLPLSIVENIEIIRGNLSALYGANAVQGVINITTRTPGGKHPATARFSAGSFGERVYGADASAKLSAVELLASAEHGDYTGNFGYTDLRGRKQTRENTQKYYNSFFGKIRTTGKRYSAAAQGYSYRAGQGLPGIIYQETPRAYSEYAKYIFSVSGTVIPAPRFSTEFAFSYHRSSTHNSNPDGFRFDTASRNSTRQAELVQHVHFSGKSSVQLGVSHKKDMLRHDDNFIPAFSIGDKWQEVNAAFLSGRVRIPVAAFFDRIDLHAALRYDNHNRIKPQTSPAAGLALSRAGIYEIIIRGNYGKSYRPPTFDDLYYEGFRVQGNPELLPERGRGGDAGIEVSVPLCGTLRMEYTYFHTVIEDIILWRKRFDGVFTPANIARSALFGSESSLEWKSPGNHVVLTLNHSFTRALNQSGERTTNNKQLPHRPVHTTFLRAAFSFSGLAFGTQERFVSRRFIREANTKPMPPYAVVDLFSTYTMQKYAGCELTAQCSVDNLLNEEYMVLERSPLPGRTVKFTLTIRF